jgi:hypothetical protein
MTKPLPRGAQEIEMSEHVLEADYVIIGAGAVGMAMADMLVA